jgi:hypothetical protein
MEDSGLGVAIARFFLAEDTRVSGYDSNISIANFINA